MAWSRPERSPDLVPPSESKAPALTRLSTTRRLTSLRSTRAQKSPRVEKRPTLSLPVTMDSMAEAPTFLMAARPKWITSPTTVKRAPEPHAAALLDVLDDLVRLLHF